MLSSLLHGNNSGSDSEREEGDLAKLEGIWSESTETLNEIELNLPSLPSSTRPTRPQLNDQAFPSLSSRPQERTILSFETDKRQRTTRLTSNGQVIYSYASLSESPSSKSGLFTQLRDKNGKVLATHIVPTAEKPMVKLGNARPITRKSWLSECGILSSNCGKFQMGNRWFKWRCVNDSGRVSVVLRDHSTKSTPIVARFTCIHRIERTNIILNYQQHTRPPHSRSHSNSNSNSRSRSHSSRRGRRSWRASLELNPDYRDVWDYAVFSLIVLECFKGGKTLPPLEYEDESGSNVSYLANLIGLFGGTA